MGAKLGDTIRSPVWGDKPFPVTQEFGITDGDPRYGYATAYGWPAGTHIGLDIGMPKGTPIYALHRGKVIFAGFDDSFRPYHVNVEDYDDPATATDETGYVEIYGHLWNNPNVKQGNDVRAGDQVGVSGEETIQGSTSVPDQTGEHLHFELRQPGADTTSGYKAIDPTYWLEQQNVVNPNEGEPGGDIIDETGNTVSSTAGGIAGAVAGLLPSATSFLQRGAIIAVGIILLAIGLIAVLRPQRFIR